jgi:hypothetical protein
MKKTSWILGLIGLAGISLAAAAYVRRPAGPHAVVSPSIQRFVTAEGQREIIARYGVTNAGRSDLILGEISKTCGCTDVSINPKVLGPGQSGIILLEGTPPPVGQTDVVVRIATNSLPDPELVLRLTMVGTKSVPYTTIDSGPVRFGVVHPGQAKLPIYVETREQTDQAPWIERTLASPPGLVLEGGLRKELSLGAGVLLRRYEYTAALTKLPDVGPFVGEVTFLARNGGSVPVLRLPVHGIVRPPVFAVPSALYASCAEQEPPTKLTLTLHTEDAHFPLNARLASHVPEMVQVVQTSRTEGTVGFQVTARMLNQGTMTLKMTFETNHPQASQVHVPLTLSGGRGDQGVYQTSQ